MSQTVGDILRLLDGIAPLELAEEWDNVGLLAGQIDQPVDTVLFALDLNRQVLEEAAGKGAQLIVTHHPILFRGRKNLREDDAEGRLLCGLVRARLAMIAMHTNYDNACPGVNDALASALGLRDVQVLENGMRLGKIGKTNFGLFADTAEKKLGGPVRRYGDPGRFVQRIAVLGGAGEDFIPQALAAGADVYLTGETSYHRALDAADNGLCVLEAGHAATELPGILALAEALQNAADAVKYKVRVLNSESRLFL